MKQLLLCLLLSYFIFVSCRNDENCPEISILEDVLIIQKDLSLRFYNTPLKNTNQNTEKILELLSHLLDSEDCYQRNIAYTVSLWLSQFLDHKSIPKFCPIAQIINASVSKDPDQLKCALGDIGDFEKVLSLYRLQNSITASGCYSNTSLLKDIKYRSCYQSGLAYEIDILWDRRGYILSPEFSDLVPNLYNSKSLLDKLIVLFLSYTLTEEFQKLSEKFPLTISLQATSLQYSCKIPKHCCENRLNILKTLSDDTSTEAKEIFDSMIPKCVCPKLCFTANDYSALQRNASIKFLEKRSQSLTIAGEEIYEELTNMIDSENFRYNEIAFQALSMYEILSINIKKLPNLCSFAAVINSTVSYSFTGSNTNMKIALENLISFAPHFVHLNHLRSISASGCKQQKPLDKPYTKLQYNCYKDGFVYDSCRLWSLKIKTVPEGLGSKVQALYRSKSQSDKLLALILSFTITDFSCIFWENCDLNLLYQSVSSLVVDPLDKCCCVDHLTNLSKISKHSLDDIFNIINITKDRFEIE